MKLSVLCFGVIYRTPSMIEEETDFMVALWTTNKRHARERMIKFRTLCPENQYFILSRYIDEEARDETTDMIYAAIAVNDAIPE